MVRRAKVECRAIISPDHECLEYYIRFGMGHKKIEIQRQWECNKGRPDITMRLLVALHSCFRKNICGIITVAKC